TICTSVPARCGAANCGVGRGIRGNMQRRHMLNATEQAPAHA
ncbi:MAG: hypothetical protein ACI90M_003153, partial [Candidatus Azotimanducaceae bacterium]